MQEGKEAHLASPSARTNISYRDGAFMVGFFLHVQGGRGPGYKVNSRKLLRVTGKVSVLRARQRDLERASVGSDNSTWFLVNDRAPTRKGRPGVRGLTD